MELNKELKAKLRNQNIQWLKADAVSHLNASDLQPTLLAVQRAEILWGKNSKVDKFRELLTTRGITIFDRKLEHHFTGSAIVIDPTTQKILLSLHPYYKIWLQLGGHEEGENNPVAISAREAWEESGIDDLWVCDWPVRVDPHPAEKCKSVKGIHHNWHYDICYMSVALHSDFKISEESEDLRWFTLDELEQLVNEGKAQDMALQMARNSIALLGVLEEMGNVPAGFK